jgi:hypothetical protein
MKEKLEVIREALKGGNFTYLGGEATVCIKPTPYKEAKALLDSLIAELEKGEVSDGYHTFNELYEHRHALFALNIAVTPEISWKSLKHDDGTMFDGWFIAGMDLPTGMITYHIPIRLWELFGGKELTNAPKWDGHTSNDVIERIKAVTATRERE